MDFRHACGSIWSGSKTPQHRQPADAAQVAKSAPQAHTQLPGEAVVDSSLGHDDQTAMAKLFEHLSVAAVLMAHLSAAGRQQQLLSKHVLLLTTGLTK
jgi:hypothetical protein